MSRSSERLPTSAFDYELPAGRIARYPAERRDHSRLLVLHRDSGAIEHGHFHELPRFFAAGDVLVLNETKVFPARLVGRRASGAPAEVLLLHPAGNGATDWRALVRPGAKLRPGRFIEIDEHLRIEVLDVLPDGDRVVRLHTDLPIQEAIERYGAIPLPPYMERVAEPIDTERYQTVYARASGSVAAPTAGLHFTDELLSRLAQVGVVLVRIVLHVGVGTFRPVEVEDPDQHVMHDEEYEVGEDAAQQINAARAARGSVWAVGTTVTRTLESAAGADGRVRAGRGSTRLFIRPGYTFRAVDRLITNFHLPRSTLLMLVSAFGGHQQVMHAYREAVSGGYRFYSYGDAMVIV